ncbi:MAG: helix-turn-helix transcriptional regulator [Clostridia bacterium]|nr:helix-turn-helix transcriptional regulator [Clostridia bacterium]
MKLIEAIGIRLDNLIQENNITIYELAKRAGVPRSTVWKIVHPDLTRIKTVKIDTIYQLADTLGIKLKVFFDNHIFDEVND